MKILNSLFKSGLLSVVLLFTVLVSISYGWYTNTSLIGKIDAETKNVSFSYKLNGSESNIVKYQVDNLAFFDVDSEDELKYFEDMHTVIKIDLENFSSDEVSYYLEFESEKSYMYDENNEPTSIAYIIGFFTESEELNLTGKTSIADFLNVDYLDSDKCTATYNSSVNLEINDGSNTGAKKTIYLHLIGVQEVDKATNDFLYDNQGNRIEYQFTLTVHSEPEKNDPIVD
mgnify:CR=1 FL=1